jgi:hypothetical protein
MARRRARPQPDQTLELPTLTRTCPHCRGPLWAAYKTQRAVSTLRGTVRLRLQVRRCRTPHCPRRSVPLRPEQEGRFALPEHEFGLDVIALIGSLRHAQHRSIPEIHAELIRRGSPSASAPSPISSTVTTSCSRCRWPTPRVSAG